MFCVSSSWKWVGLQCLRVAFPGHTHLHLLEPLLLAYIKYGSRERLRPQFRLLATLDTPAWAFKGGFCVYGISTKISCAGPCIPVQEGNDSRPPDKSVQ